MPAALAERLAARTLALIDAASESRAEAELAAEVLGALRRGRVAVRDAGDTCVVAGVTRRGELPLVLLAGHLDTVPAQGNRPGRRDAEAVHGLGAADMKGAVAVMVELALSLAAAGSNGSPAPPARPGDPPAPAVDLGFVLFGREELPLAESALTPLLGREPELLGADLVVMMEPTANALHAGCLGNINATWRFHGRSGHSARPWLADNAIHRAAAGIHALAQVPAIDHDHDGLRFTEVVSATRIAGGIAGNVIPDLATAHLNHRYAPGTTPQSAEARLRSLCEPHGELTIDSNAPSAPVRTDHPLVARLVDAGGLAVEAKQAWTPVAEFSAHGLAAVNFGPGDPSQAHARDEHVRVDALVRSFETLERFTCA